MCNMGKYPYIASAFEEFLILALLWEYLKYLLIKWSLFQVWWFKLFFINKQNYYILDAISTIFLMV